MKSLPRPLLVMAAAVFIGAVSNWLFGATPSRTVAVSPPAEQWDQGWPAQTGATAADAVWQGPRSPWGSVPKPPAPDAPPPPPPAMPIGVASADGHSMAVFKLPGNAVVQLGAGDALPGGGKVLEVAGRRIVWLDAGGARRERVLFDAAASTP